MLEITKSPFYHIPLTVRLCSCSCIFNSESELMSHVDKYLPPEVKKKQLELFEK